MAADNKSIQDIENNGERTPPTIISSGICPSPLRLPPPWMKIHDDICNKYNRPPLLLRQLAIDINNDDSLDYKWLGKIATGEISTDEITREFACMVTHDLSSKCKLAIKFETSIGGDTEGGNSESILK